MFAFTNRQRAVVEAERRKGDVATYTTPLSPSPEIRLFLSDFYRNTLYGRVEEMKLILENNPKTVAKIYKELVPEKVPSEEFWQRYYFRCEDLERIQRDLAADDAAKRKQRSETISAAMTSVQNLVTGSGPKDYEKLKDEVIFTSREGEQDEDEPIQFDFKLCVAAKSDEKTTTAAESMESGLARLEATVSGEEKKEELVTSAATKVGTPAEEEDKTEVSEAEIAKRKKRNAKKRAKKTAARAMSRSRSPQPPIRNIAPSIADDATITSTVSTECDALSKAEDCEDNKADLTEAEIAKRKKRNAKKRAKKAAVRGMSRSRSPQPPTNRHNVLLNTSISNKETDLPSKTETIATTSHADEHGDKVVEDKTEPLFKKETEIQSSPLEQNRADVKQEEIKIEESIGGTMNEDDSAPAVVSSNSEEESPSVSDEPENIAGSPNSVMFQALHDQAMRDKQLKKEASKLQATVSQLKEDVEGTTGLAAMAAAWNSNVATTAMELVADADPTQSEEKQDTEAPFDEEIAEDMIVGSVESELLDTKEKLGSDDIAALTTATVENEQTTGYPEEHEELIVEEPMSSVVTPEPLVEVEVEDFVISMTNKKLHEQEIADSDAAFDEKTVKTANQAVAQDSESTGVVVENEEALQKVHTGLFVLLMTIIVAVLAVGGTEWTTSMGNHLCSPLSPFKLLNTPDADNNGIKGVAPWWVPAEYKPSVFAHICGSERIQTVLEWKPQEKQGPTLTIHSADNLHEKPLIEKKRVQKASVRGESLEVTTKNRRWFFKSQDKTETIPAPWAKSMN